jgi:hypothetical protein
MLAADVAGISLGLFSEREYYVVQSRMGLAKDFVAFQPTTLLARSSAIVLQPHLKLDRHIALIWFARTMSASIS